MALHPHTPGQSSKSLPARSTSTELNDIAGVPREWEVAKGMLNILFYWSWITAEGLQWDLLPLSPSFHEGSVSADTCTVPTSRVTMGNTGKVNTNSEDAPFFISGIWFLALSCYWLLKNLERCPKPGESVSQHNPHKRSVVNCIAFHLMSV